MQNGQKNRSKRVRRTPPNPWPTIAHPAQLPPETDWRIWLFMGGRGAGKTRAGAEWVRQQVLAKAARRIALVGPTLSDVREVMIEGPSGLARIGKGERPVYEVSRRRLVWRSSGAEAFVFSAEDADSLRGPQFDLAWCDEIAAWPKGEAVWDMLAFGLRLGTNPRVFATTTPRPVPLVRRLMKLEAAGAAVVTRAATHANAAALAPGFIASLEARYGGSQLGRQELLGELVEDPDGALFLRAWIDDNRASGLAGAIPATFDRVVIAVDPPAGAGPGSDACGVIAAGRAGDVIFVLEDASVRGLPPAGWAARVMQAAGRWGAGRIVAESNQGGEMIRAVLQAAGAGPLASRVVLKHATRSKHDRAEPVSALYASGRIRHAGFFRDLEDEMCAFGAEGGRSPDRVDALVWAINDLTTPPKPLPGIMLL